MEGSSSSNNKQTTAAIIAGAVIVGVTLLCACMVVVVAIFIFGIGSVTNPMPPLPTAPPPEESSTPPPPPETSGGPVTIQAFTVEPGRIQAGECIEFSWSVSGADSIQLLRDETVILENAQGDDSYHECLASTTGWSCR